MWTISIHRHGLFTLSSNGFRNQAKTRRRFSASCKMSMMNSEPPGLERDRCHLRVKTKKSDSLDIVKKNEEELSIKEDASGSGQHDLKFDRIQPPEEELNHHKKFEFGQYVVREALLDEEFWTAAWLRAESHWENQTHDRYIDSYKRKFAEQEFHAIKRRCTSQHAQKATCVVTVKRDEKDVKRTVLKSVVGTLDLSIRSLLEGETFPGEKVKAPLFCSINKEDQSRYCYIANLCVAKSARRQGIGGSMLHFAIKSAKFIGVEQVYVHVHRNNKPAMVLYEKMGFEMIEMAPPSLEDQTFLLCLKPKEFTVSHITCSYSENL